jgi:hypothetical protein
MGEINTVGLLRLRATSAVASDKYVRRSAQDDVFCGGLEMQKTSVFSDFYCLPNKLALMERNPFQCFCYAGKKIVAERENSVTHGAKAFEKIVIGPCTLRRPGFPARCISHQIRQEIRGNMGHPYTVVEKRKSVA